MNPPISPDEFAATFPNATESATRAVQRAWDDWKKDEGQAGVRAVGSPDGDRDEAPNPVVELDSGNGPVGPIPGASKDTGRTFVRITSYRRRLLDEDNLSQKSTVDACRHAGLLPSDAANQAKLEINQQQVKTPAEEKTRIEIFPPGTW